MINKGGRPKSKTMTKEDCFFCEGHKLHFGDTCKACDGTGKEIVRKQLQKVYNAKNDLLIRYDIIN